MNKEQINKWIKEAHEIAVDKGFYNCPECGGKGIINCGDAEEPDRIECPNCNGTGVDPNKTYANQEAVK